MFVCAYSAHTSSPSRLKLRRFTNRHTTNEVNSICSPALGDGKGPQVFEYIPQHRSRFAACSFVTESSRPASRIKYVRCEAPCSA